ncbi:MAG: hypothetical protein IJM78_01955 [Prevotella sp.]|nr:hypothetical protein [Prevotella sp.]
MKEASPCGLASFLSYLLWQVTEEVALLVKESSLQPQLAGSISGIPHLQVFFYQVFCTGRILIKIVHTTPCFVDCSGTAAYVTEARV